jgi:DNA-directed RNA polymerase specialized sigma24 family protein
MSPPESKYELNGRAAFPSTRISVVIGASSSDRNERACALEVLSAAYWKPIYKYIRIKWHKSHDDAADLTQGFFALAIEKGFFQTYDPARAKFRTFVRTCVDGFVANEAKAAARLKRSGSAPHFSLDFAEAEAELTRSGNEDASFSLAMEDYFYREWARSLFAAAVEALRKECEANGKGIQFKLFERYDLADSDHGSELSYTSLAAEFDLPVTTVTNYLAYARREFRRIVLDKLREITPTEREFQSEASRLLGITTS